MAKDKENITDQSLLEEKQDQSNCFHRFLTENSDSYSDLEVNEFIVPRLACLHSFWCRRTSMVQ
jgi:hypothetical protein